MKYASKKISRYFKKEILKIRDESIGDKSCENVCKSHLGRRIVHSTQDEVTGKLGKKYCHAELGPSKVVNPYPRKKGEN
jgi:hypothetical protein